MSPVLRTAEADYRGISSAELDTYLALGWELAREEDEHGTVLVAWTLSNEPVVPEGKA